MGRVRRACGVVALLAAFSVAAGTMSNGSAQADEKADTPAAAAGAQTVDDIATAYQLIDFGRRHKQPMALLTAVQMLQAIHVPTVKLMEGAEKGAVPSKREELEALLEEAHRMPAGDADPIKKLAAALKDQLSQTSALEAPARGTPQKGTISGEFVADPYNPKVKDNMPGGAIVAKRDFLPGDAKIWFVKLKNPGVKLTVKVTDPHGKVVPPIGSDPTSYNFAVYKTGTPNTGTYTIDIRNLTKYQVTGRMYTN